VGVWGEMGDWVDIGIRVMRFRSLLISRSSAFPQSFLGVVRATGHHVHSMDSLIHGEWDCKPDTIFLDIRDVTSAEIQQSLNIIAMNYPLSRLVVVTSCGVPLSLAEDLCVNADDEWDLAKSSECDEQWLQPEQRTSRLLPRDVEIAGGIVRTYSEKMLDVYRTARRVAASKVPILLSGETGTGKSTMAQSIHAWSDRRDGPFVFFPCGAVSRDLIHAELFGHTKGAFTGATSDRVGKIEAAAGGTLLLDEVDLLSFDDQSKLLRVVETGEFERVGTVTTSRSQCRLIVASNVDMKDLVDKQRFRSDLFYRINVIELELPSLRQRGNDVPLLAVASLKALSEELQKPSLRVSLKLLWGLRSLTWPGNIRELRNSLLRAMTLMETNFLALEDLRLKRPEEFPRNAVGNGGIATTPLSEIMTGASREAIIDCLKTHGNHRAAVARILKISRSTLYRKIQEYNICESDLVSEVGRDK